MAVIRGESCFEKNAFEDTENPHSPTKTGLPVKEYLGKYSRYRKIFCFVSKLFLRPILFHGKLSFDNLTYFKLYGNLNSEVIQFKFDVRKFVEIMQLMVRLYISVCSFFHKHKDKEKSFRISRAMGWGRKQNSGNSVGDVSCFFFLY